MSDIRWLDEVESHAWRSLLIAHRQLLQRLDAELQAAQGISIGDYGVLVELSEVPDGRMRMTELAEKTLLSPSGLTRRLDSMVVLGLVDRVRCQNDRRGSWAVITPAGRARLAQAAPDHVEHVRSNFVERLTRQQLASLADALDAVSGGADAVCPGDRSDS